MSTIDEIGDALLLYGVHAGFQQKRREFAGVLLSSGVSADDVETIGAYVKSQADSPGSCARILASVLADEKKREEHLLDLRKKAELTRRKAPGDKPYVPAPMPGDDAQEWQQDREAMIVWSWVRSGWPHETISKELGVPLAKIPDLAKRGEKAATRFVGEPPKPQPTNQKEALRAEKDEAARRSQFRDSMKRDGRLPA